ncbi:MAG TPA: hypothetical protein VJR50_11125 [Mycobacterium sp.]|jgi:hypothetical protein|nr:hypothetical protein [Mycobacterium sp.]
MKHVMTVALLATTTTLCLSPCAEAGPNKCDWVPPAHSVFHQDNGLAIQIDWANGGQGGQASYAGAQGMDWEGPINGGVAKGSNKIDFTVPWRIKSVTYTNDAPIPAAPTNHYTGTVAENGRASGTTVNNAGVSNTWFDDGGWTCMEWGFGPAPVA